MSESIPLEDSAASQQTICDFAISTIPSVLNTTELKPIHGIQASPGYSRSLNTSIVSTVLSGFLTPTTASGSNSNERLWKLSKLFCVVLILGISFQNSYLGQRNQMA